MLAGLCRFASNHIQLPPPAGGVRLPTVQCSYERFSTCFLSLLVPGYEMGGMSGQQQHSMEDLAPPGKLS